jgi:hypothetical protein
MQFSLTSARSNTEPQTESPARGKVCPFSSVKAIDLKWHQGCPVCSKTVIRHMKKKNYHTSGDKVPTEPDTDVTQVLRLTGDCNF